MLTKLIKRFNCEELIEFFKRQDIIVLHFEKDDYHLIRQIKMSGTSFLTASKDDLFRTPLAWGLVIELFDLQTRVKTSKYFIFYYNGTFYTLINYLFV